MLFTGEAAARSNFQRQERAQLPGSRQISNKQEAADTNL